MPVYSNNLLLFIQDFFINIILSIENFYTKCEKKNSINFKNWDENHDIFLLKLPKSKVNPRAKSEACPFALQTYFILSFINGIRRFCSYLNYLKVKF
jgi:hypothetical protein